jgi:hypothetical protein
VEKSTERKPRLRQLRLSLCLALLALSLSTSIVIPYHTQARLQTPSGLLGLSHDGRGSLTPEIQLYHSLRSRYLAPLPSVNDSQSSGSPVQVGAWGDEKSVGNRGVQVEIQTNSYSSSQAEDAFWAGDLLSNSAFIQFGYLIPTPGDYCLIAHITANGTFCSGNTDNVGDADARWFWAYFPNASLVGDWYYGFGPTDSAGSNGTWHIYSILPNAAGDWSFALDGVSVYSSNFTVAASSSPAHLVAEKATGPYLAQLGPVEFRNLAYLGNDNLWHGTSSLTLIDGCGEADLAGCNPSATYGVASVGPNDVVAGSDVTVPGAGSLIWQRQSDCSLKATLQTVGSSGNAPLNVTLVDSTSAQNASLRTDWWFGDGSHQSGNSSQLVTYRLPGNYTPFVRLLDSAGCLSEASGTVSVTGTNGSGFTASLGLLVSFVVGVWKLWNVVPRDSDAPSE